LRRSDSHFGQAGMGSLPVSLGPRARHPIHACPKLCSLCAVKTLRFSLATHVELRRARHFALIPRVRVDEPTVGGVVLDS
jgi:hypothetical protein